MLGNFEKAMADLIEVHWKISSSTQKAQVAQRLNVAGYTARHATEAAEMIKSGDYANAFERLSKVLEVGVCGAKNNTWMTHNDAF